MPVGYAAMKGDELHDLYVAPESQRRGVGGALFAQVQAAYPDGFRFWVFRDNTRARPFYDARGCVVVDSTDGRQRGEAARTCSTSGGLAARGAEA